MLLTIIFALSITIKPIKMNTINTELFFTYMLLRRIDLMTTHLRIRPATECYRIAKDMVAFNKEFFTQQPIN